jgi:beta-aspartyl-peptidase (threonine type)
MFEKVPWALIAHGGAKDIALHEEEENRQGLVEAVAVGAGILSEGGSAIEAVEAVVKSLELNPAYNAGLYGSARNEDGKIEMDASIMDGNTLDIGAVAGLRDIEHPVSVARALLKDKTVFLAGEGANKFARSLNFPPPSLVSTPLKHAGGSDTVGCVARDRHGSLATATSTGGLENKRAGRVGDVPLPGCGFYADNERGAVSVSGEGEAIARVLLTSEFLHLLEDLDPDEAAARALESVAKIGGEAGLIAIAPDGRIGWAHNSAHFVVGMAKEGESNPKVFFKKSEGHAE